MSEPTNDWSQAEPDEREPANPLLSESEADDGEDYHPGVARPDLTDQANEADVVEQSYEIGSDDDGDEPTPT